MRKSEIVRRVAEATDLTQVQAEKVVNATLDAMKRGAFGNSYTWEFTPNEGQKTAQTSSKKGDL